MTLDLKLSRRQRDCAYLAAEGLQSKEIARRLGLSQHTVQQHLGDAYGRLGVRNRTQLVAKLLCQEKVQD